MTENEWVACTDCRNVMTRLFACRSCGTLEPRQKLDFPEMNRRRTAFGCSGGAVRRAAADRQGP